MTIPSARIVHRMPSRCRLRTRGMRGDQAYFAQVRTGLSQTEGVRSVRTSPLTESILIEHDGPIEPVLEEAERRGYLRLERDAKDPYLAQLNRALSDSDEKLREHTAGRLDFETLTFIGFVVGGIYQIANGRGLPAGVTLLRYAVELVGSAGVASLDKEATRERAKA